MNPVVQWVTALTIGVLRMDDKSFAKQLASWIDPHALMECAARHSTGSADVRSCLMIGGKELSSGSEANFSELVKKFLRGFHIPTPMVELLRTTYREPHMPPATWQWLQSLSLSATVQTCSPTSPPPAAPPNAILLLWERDAVLDVLRQPVLALLDLVGLLAEHWRKVAELGASVFHEHNMPDEFYAYVDHQVASSYLKLVDPDFNDAAGPKNRYRAVTVFGWPDPDNQVWELSKEFARQAALSTHQPPGKVYP